jgi:hypothetical protein
MVGNSTPSSSPDDPLASKTDQMVRIRRSDSKEGSFSPRAPQRATYAAAPDPKPTKKDRRLGWGRDEALWEESRAHGEMRSLFVAHEEAVQRSHSRVGTGSGDGLSGLRSAWRGRYCSHLPVATWLAAGCLYGVASGRQTPSGGVDHRGACSLRIARRREVGPFALLPCR